MDEIKGIKKKCLQHHIDLQDRLILSITGLISSTLGHLLHFSLNSNKYQLFSPKQYITLRYGTTARIKKSIRVSLDE